MARGRPSLKYEEIVTDEIKGMIPKWKRQGQTDEWIAKKIGVSKYKIQEWKKEFSSFSSLFKKGKDDLLLELEETLYTRAKGTYIQEEEIVESPTGTTTKFKKRYVWSDKCLEMALKKLDPDKWGDKVSVDNDDLKKLRDIFGG